MVPSIVAEDGIAFREYCRLAEGQASFFDFVAGFCRSPAKDTPRMDLSISGEMVPSIVAEDGIALRVYCRLAGGPGVIVSQPEKHL